MRTIAWVLVGVVGLLGAAWCLLAGIMTAALGTGPTSLEQLERLRTSSHQLLVGSVAFAVLAAVATTRLLKGAYRREGKSPGHQGQ